jgi:ribosome biogenesis GTPase
VHAHRDGEAVVAASPTDQAAAVDHACWSRTVLEVTTMRRRAGSHRTTDRPPVQPTDAPATFRCGQCGVLVEPLTFGGRHRNHCPRCLFSQHVDADVLGDRQSTCRGLMEPIGRLVRRTGEHVVVHRCVVCGAERRNRLAADDNLGYLLTLPLCEP